MTTIREGWALITPLNLTVGIEQQMDCLESQVASVNFLEVIDLIAAQGYKS